jgi:membrane-associated phospholipid phosphatase
VVVGEEKPLEDKAKEATHAAIAPKPSRHYRAQILQGYVIAATIAFGVLFFLARSIIYFPIDLRITLGVQTLRAGWFDVLMRLVSTLGYSPQVFFLIAFTSLALFLIGLRWEAVVTLIAAAGISVLGTVVKIVVERPRPSPDLIHVFQQLNDFSFPSGHVLFYTSFFGFLFFLFYTLLKYSWPRTLALVVLGGLVALIGLSRVYLGEHWASDVLGAYLLGSLWLVSTIYVYQWGKPRFFVHQPLAPEKRPSNFSQSPGKQ